MTASDTQIIVHILLLLLAYHHYSLHYMLPFIIWMPLLLLAALRHLPSSSSYPWLPLQKLLLDFFFLRESVSTAFLLPSSVFTLSRFSVTMWQTCQFVVSWKQAAVWALFACIWGCQCCWLFPKSGCKLGTRCLSLEHVWLELNASLCRKYICRVGFMILLHMF